MSSIAELEDETILWAKTHCPSVTVMQGKDACRGKHHCPSMIDPLLYAALIISFGGWRAGVFVAFDGLPRDPP